MSFEINPSEWRPHASTNKAQAMDNEGRGASAGGGYAGSAFGQKEPQPLEDEIEFSSTHQKKDIDEKMQDDAKNLFEQIVTWLKQLLKVLFK